MQKKLLLLLGCFVFGSVFAQQQNSYYFKISNHLKPVNDNTGAAAVMILPPKCEQITGQPIGFIARNKTAKFHCKELPTISHPFSINTGTSYFPYFNIYECLMTKPNDSADLINDHCQVTHHQLS